MNQFPKYYKELINEEPIEIGSMQLHPIRMKDYMDWIACKPALLLRLGTLPAEYAVLPYLSALYAIECDAVKNGKKAGYLFLFLHLLGLATEKRFTPNSQTVKFIVDPKNNKKLKSIHIQVGNDWIEIDNKNCAKIREAIACQNGESLPNEADNPELLEAKEIISRTRVPQLENDLLQMMDAVCLHSHIRIKDLMQWALWEFEKRMKSIRLAFGYSVCGISEGFGSKWKGGNPYPSWYLEKKQNLAQFFKPESELLKNLGKVGSIKS